MAFGCLFNHSQCQTNEGLRRIAATVTGSMAIALSLFVSPAWASDPFRATNPRPIGDQTEAAFRSMFEQGNYVAAANLLRTAEADEPLAYAMKASLAYVNQDWDDLGTQATLTRQAAEQLMQTDPLRGHLYTAVGYFLEGAHALTTEGTVAATPTLLTKLQQVFDELEAAEQIAADDPELNLIRGYMDLMLSVNLPFSDPETAIARLQNYAAPSYLVHRGLALGYRDLRQPTQALTAVDQALSETPNNPDLLYLKAQILVLQENNQGSLEFFRQALGAGGQRLPNLPRRRLEFFQQVVGTQAQLLPSMASQIAYEWCRASDRANQTQTNCRALL